MSQTHTTNNLKTLTLQYQNNDTKNFIETLHSNEIQTEKKNLYSLWLTMSGQRRSEFKTKRMNKLKSIHNNITSYVITLFRSNFTKYTFTHV